MTDVSDTGDEEPVSLQQAQKHQTPALTVVSDDDDTLDGTRTADDEVAITESPVSRRASRRTPLGSNGQNTRRRSPRNRSKVSMATTPSSGPRRRTFGGTSPSGLLCRNRATMAAFPSERGHHLDSDSDMYEMAEKLRRQYIGSSYY